MGTPTMDQNPVKVTEAAICKAAVSVLKDNGWYMVCEVYGHGHNVDAAGLRGSEIIAVEAKLSFNQSLKLQLQENRRLADYVLAVVHKRVSKENRAWCMERGIGIWLVDPNVAVINELEFAQQEETFPSMIRTFVERINRWDATIEGGKPNLLGVGVAQDVQKRVDEYKLLNPKATWKEIFKNVPSHYANHKNMYSALKLNQERLAHRARLKQIKAL